MNRNRNDSLELPMPKKRVVPVYDLFCVEICQNPSVVVLIVQDTWSGYLIIQEKGTSPLEAFGKLPAVIAVFFSLVADRLAAAEAKRRTDKGKDPVAGGADSVTV